MAGARGADQPKKGSHDAVVDRSKRKADGNFGIGPTVFNTGLEVTRVRGGKRDEEGTGPHATNRRREHRRRSPARDARHRDGPAPDRRGARRPGARGGGAVEGPVERHEGNAPGALAATRRGSDRDRARRSGAGLDGGGHDALGRALRDGSRNRASDLQSRDPPRRSSS